METFVFHQKVIQPFVLKDLRNLSNEINARVQNTEWPIPLTRNKNSNVEVASNLIEWFTIYESKICF